MNDGHKKKGQKYKNKTAFKLQFQPQAQQIHKKVSFKGLCRRCVEQMQWKIKYNKYKKMSEPAKCTFCCQKNVFRSYMRACEKCTTDKNVCPKCLEDQTTEQIQTKLNEIEQKREDAQSQKKMNDFLKTLKERSRRTVKRLYQKGKIEWRNDLGTFVDEDENVVQLQFKQGYSDKSQIGDDFDDQDFDQFGDEQQQEDATPRESFKKQKKVEKESDKQSEQIQEKDEEDENEVQQGEQRQQQQKSQTQSKGQKQCSDPIHKQSSDFQAQIQEDQENEVSKQV